MKKRLLTALAVATFGIMNAQDVKFGTKFGLNISTLAGNIQNTKNKLDFHAGLFAEIEVSDIFSVQPEILYSNQGTKAEENYIDPMRKLEVNLTQDLSYLYIPIMAKLYIFEDFYLEAGPQIGFLLNAEQVAEVSGTYYGKVINDSETVDNKENLNSKDFGANIGLGMNITKRIGASARYTAGLSNIDNETRGSEINNRNLAVSLLYNF